MSKHNLEGEKAYLVQRYGLSGLQWATFAATPLYFLSALRRRQFSVRSLARYNWVVPALGGASGTATGYAITSHESSAATASRTMEIRMDAKQVKKDDQFLVGSLVGALLVPAIFLRRVGLFNGLLGGAGLGGTAGLTTYFVQEEDVGTALSKQGKNALTTGKELADITQSKGKDLVDQGEKIASEAKQKGRDLSDKKA